MKRPHHPPRVPDSSRLAVFLAPAILATGIIHVLLPYGSLVALVNLAASLLSATAVLFAVRRRGTLYQRRGWLFIGLAGLASFVGHLVWYGADLGPWTLPAALPYVFYLLTYALMVIGLWIFGRPVESRQGSLVDALMVVVATSVMFWAVMVEPHLGSVATPQLVIHSVYPVADLLLLMFALKLFFLGERHSMALRLIIAAAAVLLTADLLHAHGAANGWYNRGGPLDLIWYAVYALLAAAAWHPSAAEPITDRPVPPQRAFRRLLVIGLLAIAVPTTLLFTADTEIQLVRVGALATIALFVLMLFRLTLLLSANHRQARVLERLIRTDPLTGAGNRRALNERLSMEMSRARRTGTPLALVFLDLDHFKRYNDSHGHACGDELLVTTIARWQDRLRGTDMLARTGGEEFVLVCADTTLEQAIEVLERLRGAIPHGQTCSAGIAMLRAEDTYDTLLHRADAGLYKAKGEGRDRVVVCHDDAWFETVSSSDL